MDDDFPILGGPLAVDLANTWYEAEDELLDFLADPTRARRWCSSVTGGDRVDDLLLLRELRDSVRSLIVARSQRRRLDAAAVEIVNRHAAAGCAHVAMIVDETGAVVTTTRYRGEGRARARLATSCVEVLAGHDPIRRCEGPGCPLLFAQDHGRRRFCHDSCSHRARMQRYRRRSS